MQMQSMRKHMEHRIEQDQQLRDRVEQARKEVCISPVIYCQCYSIHL